MPINTRLQLSLMMFLNYFIWGAWYVTIGTYMGKTLGFTGTQIGAVYATNAIAAMLSPFFVGMIADRFFASERVLGVMHLIGAACMWAATQTQDFGTLYVLILLYNLCFMPSIALTNSIAFNQMSDRGKEFPTVRALGTLGWIVIGLVIGTLAWDDKVMPLQVAAITSVVMGLYSFTLPHTPPQAKGQAVTVRGVLGLEAIELLKSRAFATVVIASVMICIPLSFYYAFANNFLNDIGLPNASARMSMGQMSEMIFLIIMPLFFARLGVKNMMLIGMAAWALRYVLFALGDTGTGVWMLYGGIILHGICYDFFFVTGQIFVDQAAPAHLKSSVQGLITFATYGLGMFIGSYASGWVVDANTTDKVVSWMPTWLAPAIFAAVVLLGFAVAFREQKREAEKVTA